MLHRHLGFGREHRVHIQLAQRFAHRAVHRIQHALPARLHFLLATQRLVEEIEVGLLEVLAQVRRGVVHGVEAQVGLPRRGRHVGQHLVQLTEEARLRQRELVLGRHLQRVEQCGPVEVRRLLVGIGGADRVVTLGRVTQFDARQRCLGQAGFEIHHSLGLRLGLCGIHARQRQQLLDVSDVGVADLGLRFVEVVALLRQTQAALADVSDGVGRILEVRAGVQREQEAIALRVAVAQIVTDGGGVVQRGNLVQLRLQRRDAGSFDGGFVRTGLPDVADLRFHRTGVSLGSSSLLDQCVLHFQRALAQDLEAAPGSLVARHRIGLEPLAVDEAIEVRTRLDGRVQIGGIERDQLRLELRLIEGHLGGFSRRGGRRVGLAAGSKRGSNCNRQGQRDELGKRHGHLRPNRERPRIAREPTCETRGLQHPARTAESHVQRAAPACS
ncbi:hypothetical protein D3C71_750070 [compost metagenome]